MRLFRTKPQASFHWMPSPASFTAVAAALCSRNAWPSLFLVPSHVFGFGVYVYLEEWTVSGFFIEGLFVKTTALLINHLVYQKENVTCAIFLTAEIAKVKFIRAVQINDVRTI
jgi:hypothetical protein